MSRAQRRRRSAGFTITEILIVVAIIGILAALTQPRLADYFANQSLKAAARSSINAFHYARTEAIKRKANVFVVFIGATEAATPDELSEIGGTAIDAAIVVVEDADTDCTIDAGELVYTFPAEEGVSWGTTASLANDTNVASDYGVAADELDFGSTFTDGSLSAGNPGSWVLFQSDGLPRAFTVNGGGGCAAISPASSGLGAIYVTNGLRDYAVALSPLGMSRLHVWDDGAGSWSN